jgi:hypothetical protein
MGRDTFYGLASGDLPPREALAAGNVEIASGKPATLERFYTIFSFAPRVPTAA